MKEKDVILKWRHTALAAGRHHDGVFFYKIPDPPFFTRSDGTRVPSSRRPFDAIMAAGRRAWALEFKMMRRKRPWRPAEVRKNIADHQYEALCLWEACGGVTARAVVLAYNATDRKLWCYRLLDGEFNHVFAIGRQGPDFSVQDFSQHFILRRPRVVEYEADPGVLADEDDVL